MWLWSGSGVCSSAARHSLIFRKENVHPKHCMGSSAANERCGCGTVYVISSRVTQPPREEVLQCAAPPSVRFLYGCTFCAQPKFSSKSRMSLAANKSRLLYVCLLSRTGSCSSFRFPCRSQSYYCRQLNLRAFFDLRLFSCYSPFGGFGISFLE